jgi:hypothetical protein
MTQYYNFLDVASSAPVIEVHGTGRRSLPPKEDSQPQLVTILVTPDAAESRNTLICLSVIKSGRSQRKPNELSPIRPFQMLQIEGAI